MMTKQEVFNLIITPILILICVITLACLMFSADAKQEDVDNLKFQINHLKQDIRVLHEDLQNLTTEEEELPIVTTR